ncbi:MAG: hypothetical protein FK731_06320 [Asgard group archaeon]|nr:hypothetical protein [Asgard group archaeon]
MTTYPYTRDLLTSGEFAGIWDIDNPARTDGEGKQIYLADEVSSAISGKTLDIPGVSCNGSSCNINFTSDLTSEEETTLATVVNNHKNNL